jgi:glutamine---fructose-6-phosphate transaminase (isomerizing)
MCGILGIFGFSDNVSSLNDLLQGLKDVESRGYDSAGVAIQTEKSVFYKKSAGKISVLEALVEKTLENQSHQFCGSGIAHTRWATHGKPTSGNSHPHNCEKEEIFVVHNGQIENYQELKNQLTLKGVPFYSDTDTEVIPKLISNYLKEGNSLLESVRLTVNHLVGLFSILVIQEGSDCLIGASNGMPLQIGIVDDGSYIVSSENIAIVRHTRQAIKVPTGNIFQINQRDGLAFQDFNGRLFRLASKEHQPYTIEGDVESISKEGFPHMMLKEIMEQPRTLKATMGPKTLQGDRLNFDTGNVVLGGLKDSDEKLRTIKRVIILGIGTSYFAAQLGKLYIEKIAKIPTTAEESPDFPYNDPVMDSDTLVISISQSGESIETINALKEAETKGAFRIGITNKVGSKISEMTQAGVYCHIGHEIAVASTKAFTSQSLILLMIATYLGRQRGFSLSDGQDLIRSIEELPTLVAQTLQLNPQIEILAKKYSNYKNIYCIGRKYNNPIAEEGALKIKEVSYLHAEGYNAGVQKHGPIALVQDDFLTIAICPKDSMLSKIENAINQIKSRDGIILAITSEDNPNVSNVDDVIRVPKTREKLYPFLITPVLQLLSYHMSVARGIDPDMPRNLAKSVTVE